MIKSHREKVGYLKFSGIIFRNRNDNCLAKAVYSLARIRSANCPYGVTVSTFSRPPSPVYRNIATELSICVWFPYML